jgi:hypothetical protein
MVALTLVMPVTTASGNVVGAVWVVDDGLGVADEVDVAGADAEDVELDVAGGVGLTPVQAARRVTATASVAPRNLPDEFTAPA